MLLMSYMIYSHGSKENIGRCTSSVAQCTRKGPRRLQYLLTPGFLDMNPSKISLPILTVTALFPVVSWQTVVTLGPRGTIFTLAEARAVTPVMNRTHLVAVTL